MAVIRLKHLFGAIVLPVLLLGFLIPATVAQTAILFQKNWRDGGSIGTTASGVALDASGNSYVVGTYETSSTTCSPPPIIICTTYTYWYMLLLKHSPTGSLIWQKNLAIGSGSSSLGITFSSPGYGRSVAVDSAGNLVVSGTDAQQILVSKTDSSGNLLWLRTWGNSSSLGNEGYGAAVNASGDVYATGYISSFSAGAGQQDIVLLKFDASGTLVWQRTWGGPGHDFGHGVAVGPSGSIYVVGSTTSFSAGGLDAVILKFNSTGGLVWQRTWGGGSDDEASGEAVDASGNIYVTGYTKSFGSGGADVFLLKFDQSGTLLWQKTWGGSSDDEGSSVALDSSGNIYITGFTQSSPATQSRVLLLKFDPSGTLLWQKTWGGSPANDLGSGVASDDDTTGPPAVIVTGTVGEGPPYTLGTPGFSPLNSTFTPGTFGNDTLGKPNFTPAGSGGTLGTVSGSQTAMPGSIFLLKYGSIPTVLFQTNPNTGGSINFNSTTYTNNQSGNYTYGNATISATPPAGFSFAGWSATGGVSIVNPTTNPTTAIVTGSGSVMATFTKLKVTPVSPEALLLASLATPALAMLRRRRSK